MQAQQSCAAAWLGPYGTMGEAVQVVCKGCKSRGHKVTSQLQIVDLQRYACSASLYKTRRGCVQIFDLQSEAVQGVGFVRSLAQPTAVQLPAQQSCATAANRRFASKQPFDLQASQKRSFCAQAPRCKSTICKRSNPLHSRRLCSRLANRRFAVHSFAVQGYGFVSANIFFHLA